MESTHSKEFKENPSEDLSILKVLIKKSSSALLKNPFLNLTVERLKFKKPQFRVNTCLQSKIVEASSFKR